MFQGVIYMKDLYYQEQSNWSTEDYYYLHRCLHKLIWYYKKNTAEIEKMDVSRMSENTKVLIYCIIKYYNMEFLFDIFENLRSLADTKPLEKTLVLDTEPLPEDNIYKRMNVAY